VQALNWRWLFFVILPFSILSLILGIIFLENVTKLSKPHLDLVSVILSIIGFGGLIYGASNLGSGSPAVRPTANNGNTRNRLRRKSSKKLRLKKRFYVPRTWRRASSFLPVICRKRSYRKAFRQFNLPQVKDSVYCLLVMKKTLIILRKTLASHTA
jgi:hypothetical protein